MFYTHMADPLAPGVTPGATVKKGQVLGHVAKPPPGSPIHLHFAYKEGNPCAYLRNCKSVSGAAPGYLPC